MVNIDETDLQILNLLSENSRMPIKDIGLTIHLSSPSVATRIAKLESLGIIERYTLKVNFEKMGKPIVAIVTVMMKTSPDHESFLKFIQQEESIVEAFRVSGRGCYSLKINVPSNSELERILDQILRFGNYQVNLSIRQVK